MITTYIKELMRYWQFDEGNGNLNRYCRIEEMPASRLAYHLGTPAIQHTIRTAVPEALLAHQPDYARKLTYPALHAFVLVPRCAGQMRRGTPNLAIIVPPHWTDEYAQSPAVYAEYGCDHDYVETILGRCYRKITCSKCGYGEEIDSGD